MLLLIYILIGLAVGSFLNVLIIRTHAGTKPTGRSQCPHCKKTLQWYELIPLVSFIFQRGRCRACNVQISWQYPLVEVFTGLGFLGAAVIFSSTPFIAGWVAIAWALTILIVAYDLLHREIPNTFAGALGVWVLIALFVFWHDTIGVRLLAGAGLSLFFLLLYTISRARWIGGGDVKLALVLGTWVSWPEILVLFFIAYILGALIGIVLIVTGVAKRKSALPFAPFLLAGTWAAFIWGKELLNWYTHIVL